MNRPGYAAWNQPDDFSALDAIPGNDDDFSTFLNLDNIDFDFTGLDGNNVEGARAEDSAMRDVSGLSLDGTAYSAYDPNAQQASYHIGGVPRSQDEAVTPVSISNGNTPYQYASQHASRQLAPSYSQHISVPPTPQSSEIYANPQMYLSQLESHMPGNMSSQYQIKHHMAPSFTPLVTPEFADNDTQAGRDVVTPASYLSPLTSPAITPQQQSRHGTRPHTAESSLAASPLDAMMIMDNMPPVQTEPPKKTRKRVPAAPKSGVPNVKSRAGTAGRKKQSRRDSLGDEGNTREARLQQIPAEPSPLSPQPPMQSETMAPPPKPRNANSTPNIKPAPPKQSPSSLPPATPASLMRLPQQAQAQPKPTASPRDPGTADTDMENSSPTTGEIGSSLSELRLPDAATDTISSAPVTRPSSGTKPAPRSASSTVRRSPLLSPTVSGSTTGGGKTPDSKPPSARGRKRNSTSSNVPSPALRPRISPSIKPLLPEGVGQRISDETHALLLASKSNYQNILEGTHLPGVSYPSELSTNITSKRTSHKIAEQGRRNRINVALQEMQSLLPPAAVGSAGVSPGSKGASPGADEDTAMAGSAEVGAAGKGSPEKLTAQQSNSKAATVEQAIDYIKNLSGRLVEKDAENEALKREVDILKARLSGSEASS